MFTQHHKNYYTQDTHKLNTKLFVELDPALKEIKADTGA
jgi:hypothetical protein